MKLLPGDIQQVHKDFPHLVDRSTAVARKMGFPEIVLPGEAAVPVPYTAGRGDPRLEPAVWELSVCAGPVQGESWYMPAASVYSLCMSVLYTTSCTHW